MLPSYHLATAFEGRNPYALSSTLKTKLVSQTTSKIPIRIQEMYPCVNNIYIYINELHKRRKFLYYFDDQFINKSYQRSCNISKTFSILLQVRHQVRDFPLQLLRSPFPMPLNPHALPRIHPLPYLPRHTNEQKHVSRT